VRAELLPTLPVGGPPAANDRLRNELSRLPLPWPSSRGIALTDADRQKLGLLPKLTIGIAILLVIADTYWYGVTAEVFERLWRQLLDRPSGPVSFRFILQPSVAVIAAIKDGIEDARTGRSPYFWTIVRYPRERMGRLGEGLAATAQILLIGMAIDVIYQYLEFKTFYPNEALIIALLLAFVPYLLFRGPAARIARWWCGHPPGEIR